MAPGPAKLARALAALAALALAPLALAPLAWATAARAEPAMWVVRDKDSTIVLFGSFHLLPPGQAWRPKALDAALSQADDLWFEIPLDSDSAAAAQRDALARSMLPPGKTLSSMLSPRGRKRLQTVARQVGAPMDTLDRLQPWYAETVLGVAVYQQQGAVVEQGVERQLNAIAPPRIPRRALETAAQQLDMFGGGTRAQQVASLEDTLRQFETDPGYLPRILKLWMGGDVAGLDRMVLGDMRRTAPADYKALIVDRNRAWLPVIERRLAGSGHTVMVVGVGHLVGKDGLPALLRKDGITVEGP